MGEMDQDPEQVGDSEDLFDADDIHGGEVEGGNEDDLEPPNIHVDDWDELDAHLGGEIGAAAVGAEEEDGQMQVHPYSISSRMLRHRV